MAQAGATLTEVTIGYEELARSAQDFLANRPIVVLGSGATAPYGLPSMAELADHLLASCDPDLPGWTEFATRLRETKDLERTLHDVLLPSTTVDALVDTTWQIVSTRDLEFYNKILNREVKFPLAELFRYLLRTADSHVRVVTTNYDRVAEYAANCVDAYVSTGLTSGWLQRFVPTTVNTERRRRLGYEGQVTVFKVHGSLDWFRNATSEVVGVPLAVTVPPNTKPLLVTPGVAKYKEVHKDPFRTVMAEADAVLRQGQSYLCIGYGFNDEHVQPILVNRVRKDGVPLLIVAKSLTESTRKAFLSNPPEQFLFLEEAKTGTMVYSHKYPAGAICSDVSVWEMDQFMAMVTGKDVR